MPEPSTTRDRQKAKALIESLNWPPSKERVVTWLMETAAQARQEGREEGIEAAVKELRMLGNSRGAAQLNVRLINQTAPDRAKE